MRHPVYIFYLLLLLLRFTHIYICITHYPDTLYIIIKRNIIFIYKSERARIRFSLFTRIEPRYHKNRCIRRSLVSVTLRAARVRAAIVSRVIPRVGPP